MFTTSNEYQPVEPFDALNLEWARLHADPAVARLVDSWVAEDPALAPLAGGLLALPAAFRACDHAGQDAHLLALLRRAAAKDRGGELATRIITQLMLPRAIRVSLWLSSDLGSRADRQQLVLATLLDTIRRVPPHKDSFVGLYLAQKLWERMRGSVLHVRRTRLMEIALADAGEVHGDAGVRPDPACTVLRIATTPDGNAHEQLLQLLRWAITTGALDQESARLLAERCSFEGHYRGEGRSSTAGLARELGINEAALRKRLSRAQKRLAAAVADAVAA